MGSKTKYFLMCEELICEWPCLEKGFPEGENSPREDTVSQVKVYMDEEKTQMPFGMIENGLS